MADPISIRTGFQGTQPNTLEQKGPEQGKKTGESKFDQVRNQMADQQNMQVNMPPEVKQVTPAEKQNLISDLRKRLDSPGNKSPQEMFGPDMKHARVQMDGLQNRVNALPKNEAFDPIRNRLTTMESQFEKTNKMLAGIQNMQDPRELLKVQMELFQLTQNVELLSKVVEQANTGLKTLLQTQV